MQTKIEHSVPPLADNSRLSLVEFTKQFTQFTIDCAFFRKNSQSKIDSLQNNYEALISHYAGIIEAVKDQIATNQNKLKKVEYYGEDGEPLKSRITNEIGRQNKYLEELKSQQSKTTSLKFLFTLHPNELIQEAIKEKSSASLIVQTPELIAKIPNYQIVHITHQDSDIIKSLASILVAREYTFEMPNIYAALKQHVKTQSDQKVILDKENEAIRKLLLKINSYLDKKIEQALNGNTHPWAIGYFGSSYKLNKDDKKVSVPQGIYELKTHLDQLGTIPPSQILDDIQVTLRTKLAEIKDESIFKHINRFVSYLFGYFRSQETIQEYEHLEQVTLGKKSV